MSAKNRVRKPFQVIGAVLGLVCRPKNWPELYRTACVAFDDRFPPPEPWEGVRVPGGRHRRGYDREHENSQS